MLRLPLGLFGFVGRTAGDAARSGVQFVRHTSGIWHLFLATLYYSTLAPLTGRSRLREQLFLMLRNVGVQSFAITCLVSFLLGAILVLLVGKPLDDVGQIQVVPAAVGWSLTREISPLITAIVITARVGGSFTAVIASMKINEELMALETMAIHPVGYLVAPRFLSMLVMLPALSLFSVFIGMGGAALVANAVYGLPFHMYAERTEFFLTLADLNSGLIKSVVFATLVSLICCYYGLITEGGPMGLGRNVMIAVVTSIVAIILADTLATALITNYELLGRAT